MDLFIFCHLNCFFFRQDHLEISPTKLDFLESGERVNTILETSPTRYMGAIIFDDFKIGDEDLPENISYTIRYPIKTTMYVFLAIHTFKLLIVLLGQKKMENFAFCSSEPSKRFHHCIF